MAILAMWLILPLGMQDRLPQDAIPYVAAGNLSHGHPDEIYAARNGDLYDLKPAFWEEWCAVAPAGADCDQFAIAFVASPLAIPGAWLVSRLGDAGGLLLMQFGAAAMLAGGMWLLWRRLAFRSRRAPGLLVVTALLLTPMAITPISLGQTSPILFLSVCLGISNHGTRRRTASALAWTAATALKVFPAALIAMLAWRRKWRFLAWAGVGLIALATLSLLFMPLDTWGDFIRTTGALSGRTASNAYNGSLNALVLRRFGSSPSQTTILVSRAVSIVSALAVCWCAMRGTDDDTRWAGGYLALLLLTPLVWWHYVWVAIGALGVVLSMQRRLNDRLIVLLPLAALLTLPVSIPNANGHPLAIPQALVLLVFTGVYCFLARKSRFLPRPRPRFAGA